MCLKQMMMMEQSTTTATPTTTTTLGQQSQIQHQPYQQSQQGTGTNNSLLGPSGGVGGSVSGGIGSGNSVSQVGEEGILSLASISDHPTNSVIAANNRSIQGGNVSTTATNSSGTTATTGTGNTISTGIATTSTASTTSPAGTPPGKIFGRNFNGTMVVTSAPTNEAELQLYRVLQRASLLAYYDTLLEMGGDDVQQLCDAGEEEFLEIMALVGMASKPLHVRRLQKSLHEWVNNPSVFQTPLPGGTETSHVMYSPEPSNTSRSPFGAAGATPISTTTAVAAPVPSFAPSQSSNSSISSSAFCNLGPSLGSPISTTSVQLTPSLTETQMSRLTSAAEQMSRELPQMEPRAQKSRKSASKELEQVMAMSESDPRRIDEIRKYAAIYGRFDCKRKPEKPLTLHEVCVNEAAAQLCKFVPALLTRRDELFPLARRIVRVSGFGHSAGITRFGMMNQQSSSTNNRHDDREDAIAKRTRLSSNEGHSDTTKDGTEECRSSLLSICQRIGRTYDISDVSKYSRRYLFNCNYVRAEMDDTDSRFSFSSSSSPPLQGGNGIEPETMITEVGDNGHEQTYDTRHRLTKSPDTSNCGQLGVQVISASGGHIIAVANPALALSPALNDTLNVKREALSPDIR